MAGNDNSGRKIKGEAPRERVHNMRITAYEQTLIKAVAAGLSKEFDFKVTGTMALLHGLHKLKEKYGITVAETPIENQTTIFDQ